MGSGDTGKAVKARLNAAFRAGDASGVIALLDREGADLGAAARGFHGARAFLTTGQAAQALALLDAAPGAAKEQWHRKMTAQALLALGRYDAAMAVVDGGGLPAPLARTICARSAQAALADGDSAAAAARGLKYRHMVDGPDGRFLTDLVALVQADEIEALRARLKLCGPDPAFTLGRALREALFGGKGAACASPDRLRRILALAPDRVALWQLYNGLNRGKRPVPSAVYALVWRHIAAALPETPIDLNAPVVPVAEEPEVAPELHVVADWIGVPPGRRADWCARQAAAQAAADTLSAAILGRADHRRSILDRLPPVDWSEVRSAIDGGTPVILTASHASFATAMPLEFLRSGIDVRVVSSPRFFANVPEFVAMHYPELDGRNPMRTARKMVELLRAGACIFATSDGQMGAKIREFPDLGLRARLPSGLWPLARRYGARVVWIETGWRDGGLRTTLSAMEPPSWDLDDAALHEAWHRAVLTRLRAAWRADIRNVHGNRVLVELTECGRSNSG
jgi:hypothetical protein